VSKYGNVRTEYAGQLYASKAEAEYARRLDRRLAAGEIRAWRRGGPWTLLDAPRRPHRITYTPDFEVEDAAGRLAVVDVKGVETEVFKLKARLWKAVYPDVPLVVVRADGSEVRP
jgi:Protein of unknown function (DUF1064)